MEVLKRLELMKERTSVCDHSQRNSRPQQNNPPNRSGDSRFGGPGQVRQVQRYVPNEREIWRRNRDQMSYRGRDSREERSRPEESRNNIWGRSRDQERNNREERPRGTEEN